MQRKCRARLPLQTFMTWAGSARRQAGRPRRARQTGGCSVDRRHRSMAALMLGASAATILLAGAAPSWAASTPKITKEQELAAYLAEKPAAVQPLFRSAFLEGDRNLVLNLDRAGLA